MVISKEPKLQEITDEKMFSEVFEGFKVFFLNEIKNTLERKGTSLLEEQESQIRQQLEKILNPPMTEDNKKKRIDLTFSDLLSLVSPHIDRVFCINLSNYSKNLPLNHATSFEETNKLIENIKKFTGKCGSTVYIRNHKKGSVIVGAGRQRHTHGGNRKGFE